jgi:hypothetical protein
MISDQVSEQSQGVSHRKKKILVSGRVATDSNVP